MRKLWNNTWVRFAVRASLIAMIALFALGFVLANAYVRASKDALIQFSRSKAEQTVSHLDSAIETVFSNVYTIYNDPDVFQWLYKQDHDPYRDIRMTISVGRYLKNAQYLWDVFLFNAHGGRISSWKTGITTYEAPASKELLKMAQNARPGLVRLRPFVYDGMGSLTLTYPMSMVEKSYAGRLIMLVDTAAMEQNIFFGGKARIRNSCLCSTKMALVSWALLRRICRRFCWMKICAQVARAFLNGSMEEC